MRSNIFVSLSLIFVFLFCFSSNSVRAQNLFQVGTIPTSFCDPVDYIINDLLPTDTNIVGDAVTSPGGSYPVILTPNIKYKKGAMWYKKPINIYNGFTTEFTMSLKSDDSDMTCEELNNVQVKTANSKTCFRYCKPNPLADSQCCQSYAQQVLDSGSSGSTRCGGQGVVFVVQQDHADSIGSTGTGMGYSGLNNVLAIEFDTFYDQSVGDPSTVSERHISLILKKGMADASEVNSLAMNIAPVNFKNSHFENWISDPVVRIEYLNNNIRVFINGILQLAYYNPLNLANFFDASTNPLFYIGFTASTGELSQKQLIQNWRVSIAQADADNSDIVSVVTPSNGITAGQNFDVQLAIRDRCRNFYYTTDTTQILAGGFGDYNKTCKALNIKAAPTDAIKSLSYNFIVSFNCTLNGENYLDLQWFNQGVQSFRDLKLMPLRVTIKAAPLFYAEVQWTNHGWLDASQGASPTITADVVLGVTIIPKDTYGNEVGITDSFINTISVVWPDKTSNSKLVTVIDRSGTRLKLNVTVSSAGVYNITSQYFRIPYNFTVIPGIVNAATTDCFLGDSKGYRFSASNSTMKAGSTDVYIYVLLKDSVKNLIPINLTDIDNQVDGFGVDWNGVMLNNSYANAIDSWNNNANLSNNTIVNMNGVAYVQYKTTPYRAGNIMYQVFIRGVLATLQVNTITVIPGDFCASCPNVADYIEIWPMNTDTSKFYRPNVTSSIIMYRKNSFKALVVTCDIYFNPISTQVDYTLTMAGQLMYPISFDRSSYQNTATQYSISNNNARDNDNFNSLVARENYYLLVNNSKGQLLRNVTLSLVTFDSDTACGNGPWIPENTEFWSWTKLSASAPIRCTNSLADSSNLVSFGVRLKNAEKKRVNRWFVNLANLKLNTSLSNAVYEKSSAVRSSVERGTYTVNYVSSRAEFSNNGRKIQVAIDKSEIYGPTGVGLWPDDPVQYKIIYPGQKRLLADSSAYAAKDFILGLTLNATIVPQPPLYAYLVDNSGNKITNNVLSTFQDVNTIYTVDGVSRFNIMVFDTYDNPAWFNNPNWFKVESRLDKVSFLSTFNPYVLAPTCNPSTNTTGLYICTLQTVQAGYFTIYSDLFTPTSRTGLNFNTYYIYVGPGAPSATQSYSEVDLTTQTYFNATQNATFYITPKDQYGNLLGSSLALKNDGFALLSQAANQNSYVATGVAPTNDASTNGQRIKFSLQLNVSGIALFKPTLSGSAVSCQYCSVTVKPNSPAWPSSKVSQLVDSTWQVLNLSANLTLDNFNKAPSFYVEITDAAGNLVGQIPSGWTNFIAYLNHPTFARFTLQGTPYQNGVKFALNNDDIVNYTNIVFDNRWTLTFGAYDPTKGTLYITVAGKVITLGQGLEDAMYDSGPIDYKQSQVVPVSTIMKAGEVFIINVETKTAVNKIKKAYYPDGVLGNVIINTAGLNNGVYNGPGLTMINSGRSSKYGVYSFYFNNTQAGTFKISANIKTDDGAKDIPQSIYVTVVPGDLYSVSFKNPAGVVASKTDFYNFTVDNTITFILVPVDFFNNSIPQLQPKALGVSLTQPGNTNAVAGVVVEKLADSNFGVTLTPKTVGVFQYSHFDATKPQNAAVFKVNIKTGNPSPANSIARVANTNIKAGEDAILWVFPTDAYQNPVLPSEVNSRFGTKTFYADYTAPNANSPISLGMGTYDTTNVSAANYQWKAPNLTLAGVYTFRAYFNNDASQQVKYLERTVTVQSQIPEFFNGVLMVQDPTTLIYKAIPRVADPEKAPQAPPAIIWDPKYKPNFKFVLYDRYGNLVLNTIYNWNMTLMLTSRQNNEAANIYWCYNNDMSFHFCANNESAQANAYTGSPNKLWLELVYSNTYQIQLSNGELTYSANWTFSGSNPNDVGASDNALDVTKTALTPQGGIMTITAGKSITLNVELRATDGKRKKMILDDPSQNFTLKFSQDGDAGSVSYKVSNGALLGQYIIVVTFYKTYPMTNPNQITLSFDNKQFLGFQPLVSVAPDVATDIFVSGTQGQDKSQLVGATVDSKYQFLVQAIDKYLNAVPLKAEGLNVRITGPSSNSVAFSSYTVSNVNVSVIFQPTVVGTYTIIVDQKHTYTVTFTNGIPSSDKTTYTLTSSVQKAGEANKLVATILDQFGNKVPVDNKLVLNFTASFALHNSFDSYILPNPLISDNTVSYDITINTTSIYDFTFAYQNKEAICQGCSVKVNSADASFDQSTVEFYSNTINDFVQFSSPNTSIIENNLIYQPFYRIILRDRFGNKLDSTPSGYSVSLVFTGGDAPIAFNSTVNKDSNIIYSLPTTPITFGKNKYDTAGDYWAGLLYKNVSDYQLVFTHDNQSKIQPVIIKGNGAKDLDASLEDFSINNTAISAANLSIIAHQYTYFSVLAKTIDNKRKADFTKANIKVIFAIPHPTNNYTVIPGEQAGIYIITITTDKAYSASDNQFLTITINGEVHSQTISLIVTPAPLYFASIVGANGTLIPNANASSGYQFRVLGTDEYRNPINGISSQIVSLQAYIRNVGEDKMRPRVNVSEANGGLLYTVDATFAGDYVIGSPMFKDPMMYNYTIKPAHAYAPNCDLSVIVSNSASVVAGADSIQVILAVHDEFGNILTGKDVDFGSFDFDFIGETGASYSCDFTTKSNWKFVNCTIYPTVADNYKLQPRVYGIDVPCKNCYFTVVPGELSINATAFIKEVSLGVYVSLSNMSIAYGSSGVTLQARFRDFWGNAIRDISDSDVFLIELSGHDMNTMYLTQSRSNGIVTFSIPANETEIFSRLVPANDYKLMIVQSHSGITRGNVTLQFIIEGEPTDAGNGDIDVYETVYKVSNNTVYGTAGVPTSFIVELRNKQSKRYNGPLNESDVLIRSSDGNDTGIVFNTLFTGTNGRYLFTVTSNVSFTSGTRKFLSVYVKNQEASVKVMMLIAPAFPTSFVLLTQNLTGSSLPENTAQTISFELYDQFGNQYTDQKVASLIQVVSQSNNIDFDNVTQGGPNYSRFSVRFVPYFPPQATYVDVLLTTPSKDGDSVRSVLGAPFVFNTLTTIDPPSTDIVGGDYLGMPVDRDMNFTVLVRNKKLYCYVGDAVVTVNFYGPYSSYRVNDLTRDPTMTEWSNGSALITPVALTDDVSMGSNPKTAHSCGKYYSASVPANTLKKAGIYQLEISINGKVAIQKRETLMRAGDAYPTRTSAFIPTGYGNKDRGDAPISIVANSTFTFLMQLYDQWDNIITTDNGKIPAGFKFADAHVAENSASYTVVNNRNGSYAITTRLTQKGVYNTLKFSVNGIEYPRVSEKLVNFPSYVQITAGYCTNVFPQSPVLDGLINGTVIVGRRNYLHLICADQYGNTITETKPEAQFTVDAYGEDLFTVGFDRIYPVVTPDINGTYRVTFTTAWNGTYNFAVQLRKLPFSKFTLPAANHECPDATPYYCKNITDSNGTSGCVAGPNQCTFSDIVLSGNSITPIKCGNGSQVSSGRSIQDCDCIAPLVKCKVTGMCVDPTYSCPDSISMNCPSQFPVKCPDGTCKANLGACPSQKTCAPGYYMCPNLQCVESASECAVSWSICPPPGDSINIFKCADQSCAASLEDCPSRVSCPIPGQVYCEGTCVDNQLLCPQPAKCFDPTPIGCPDGSCAASLSSCPSSITCGANEALCVDGTCSTDCTTNSNIIVKNERIRRMLATEDSSSFTQYVCATGEKVANAYNCPSSHYCESSKVKCSDGSCANSLSECAQKICATGLVACWDGKCEADGSRCATRPSCPESLSTLCSDGSCKESASSCDSYVGCPVYFPFRCGSGECRARLQDCPTLTTCPAKLPIKCPDGKCVPSKASCLTAAQETCSKVGQTYRCPDGSCAASKSLCPTAVTCPVGKIRCWNGDCQISINNCPTIAADTLACPTSAPILCGDGSCRADALDCPTPVICPVNRPVLCDDGNCRSSADKCYSDSGCNTGTKRCPDGSCVGPLDACGSSVTCAADAPYKCPDMTCKKQPSDCPEAKECDSKANIRCSDGNCVTNRIFCRALPICALATPVLCPDMISCVASRSLCKSIDTCPAGMIRCDDGSCSYSSFSCPTASCPAHLSYKCKDGFCVSDSKFCANETNGCPYNTPLKCPDGSCTDDLSNCISIEPEEYCNSTTLKICADGSCANDCTYINVFGCASGQIRCANGQCINPNQTNCSVASCPPEAPAKCIDGRCVSSQANCRSSIIKEDFNSCKDSDDGNIVPCADGTCVASAEQCRPILPCATNFVRCPDGSCRANSNMCPKKNTCPASRNWRCESGICATGPDSCPLENGCPAKYGVRCIKSGQCISNKYEVVLASLGVKRSELLSEINCSTNPEKCKLCDSATDDQINAAKNGTGDQKYLACEVHEDLCTIIYTRTVLSNGCVFDKPFRCTDGGCATSPNQCKPYNPCSNASMTVVDNETNATTVVKTPYKCLDNTCVATAEQCKIKNYDCSSEPVNKFQCPDNKCARDATGCLTKESCPVATPFKCSDGKCYSAPLGRNGESGCSASVQCPAYKPFVCADGSCVGDYSFCQVETPCPADKVRCIDRSCAASISECDQTRCPPKSPILCSSGNCVSTPVECLDSSQICPQETPFRCAVGLCAAAPSHCSIYNSMKTRRILADGSVQTVVDPGCNTNTPHKCWDGSCRASLSNCPILDGCFNPQLPYRCPDGSCSASRSQCAGKLQSCGDGYELCTDSICRAVGQCLSYFGCPLTRPLQCGNGFCAKSLADCAGESDCPPTTPFRCSSGTCVSEMSQCPRAIRTYHSEDMAITVSPISTSVVEFINEGGSTVHHGVLTIPSGALLPPLSDPTANSSTFSDNGILEVKPVADSVVANLTNTIDESRIDYVSLVFGLSDATLGFYQTVRSAVISFNAIDREDSAQYRFPLFLQIDIDYNTGDNSDYCFAKANFTTNTWDCLRENSVKNEATNSTPFIGLVEEDGIYAVIFNPTRKEAQLQVITLTWWDQHKKQVLLYGGITLLCLTIFSLILWRMLRYVTKYRKSKKIMEDAQKQIDDLGRADTDIVGQSLKDKIEGIVFVANPMHEKHEKPDLSSDIREMEKALSKLDERDKQLETDNSTLDSRNKNLEREISKLKGQFAQ